MKWSDRRGFKTDITFSFPRREVGHATENVLQMDQLHLQERWKGSNHQGCRQRSSRWNCAAPAPRNHYGEETGRST